MPDLNKLEVPRYSADQPYHWEYDNLPLETLEKRDELINSEVNIHSLILADSAGTQGTLSNRLIQSIDGDGNLKEDAIDTADHNIAYHSDGSRTVDTDELQSYIDLGFNDLINPVEFVRMLSSERIKLSSVAEDATNITISVEIPSNIINFEEDNIILAESETIDWSISESNKIKANLKISTDFAHRHYNNIIPVMEPILTVEYKKFKVTSVSTPYIEDSLKVYINGIKLSPNSSLYHPNNNVSEWQLNGYTPDHENGTFELDNVITEDDIIEIDFEVLLA